MKCLETSFLIDYLDGHEAAGAYLEDHPNTPFFAPALSLYEVYRGAARSGDVKQWNESKTPSTGSNHSVSIARVHEKQRSSRPNCSTLGLRSISATY